MKFPSQLKSVSAIAAVLALGACADMNTNRAPSNYPPPTQSNAAYSGYGVVQAIDLVGQSNSGVPAGAINANQAVAWYPGKPASAIVGNSGAVGERSSEVTARARTLPALANSKTLAKAQKHMLMRPAMTSGKMVVPLL